MTSTKPFLFETRFISLRPFFDGYHFWLDWQTNQTQLEWALDGSLAAPASNAQRQQRAVGSGAVLRRRALDNWSSYSTAVRFLCRISSLLHSVNLILFTLHLVHLILCMSPHHSHHLRSHYLSLRQPFTPDLKLISFTNPFLHSHSYSFRTAFTDLEPVLN